MSHVPVPQTMLVYVPFALMCSTCTSPVFETHVPGPLNAKLPLPPTHGVAGVRAVVTASKWQALVTTVSAPAGATRPASAPTAAPSAARTLNFDMEAPPLGRLAPYRVNDREARRVPSDL